MTLDSHVDTIPYLKKKLVHDILPCDDWRRFMAGNGLIPASEDVETMEHAASHMRLNQLTPIISSIRTLSSLAGEVVGRSILEDQGMGSDERALESYRKVAMVSADVVIANLIEMNLIHIGGNQ